MFSFNKTKAILLGLCALFSLAFFLAFMVILSQGQPTNMVFLSLTSSLITGFAAVVIALDLFKQTKTMKVDIFIKKGTPFNIASPDIEDVHLTSINKKLSKRGLATREIVAHVIHYYEERKSLGSIHPKSVLQINFQENSDEEEDNKDDDTDDGEETSVKATVHTKTTTTNAAKTNKDELVAEKSA